MHRQTEVVRTVLRARIMGKTDTAHCLSHDVIRGCIKASGIVDQKTGMKNSQWSRGDLSTIIHLLDMGEVEVQEALELFINSLEHANLLP